MRRSGGGSKVRSGFARNLRRLRPRLMGTWHLDEISVSIQGSRTYLWRAVDSEGENPGHPHPVVARQGFCPEAHAEAVMKPPVASWASRLATNRVYARTTERENSHQLVRRRERKLHGFKSPGSAERFLSIHSPVYNTFNRQRQLISRRTLRLLRAETAQPR